MRIIYLLILSSLISIAFLWLGKYGVIRKKVAMISACASLVCGGAMLAMAVLPGNSFYGETITHGKVVDGNKIVMLDDPIEQVSTGMLTIYIVLGIIVIVSIVGLSTYYYMAKGIRVGSEKVNKIRKRKIRK